MIYTLKQFAEMFNTTEHTIRYYTDINLLIACLKGCGASIEDIKEYCDLCRLPESRETLYARYQIILRQREQAYKRIEEANATAAYMDEKVQHYEQILSGLIPDDSNPEYWTEDTRPFFRAKECRVKAGG